ncbi:MAG: nucleotidyltransferase domain-containing protein [Alphaproteobacteria bacterium]|nr:MAG: nucleotidyltransferase domain-containing protein [Alphaproteobacteria bacterium]
MKFGLSDAAIATIHAAFKKYPAIERAVIYGSRAKGNYKQGSDIDLTLFGEGLTADILMRIAQVLDDSMLPYLVDISVFDHLDNANLREHILRVGLVFYEWSEAQDEQ